MATPLEFHTPKLPGCGEIDWGRFSGVLADVGFSGSIAVEVEDRAFEKTLETRKAALTRSSRFLRNFLSREG